MTRDTSGDCNRGVAAPDGRTHRLLKRDTLGTIELVSDADRTTIVRDARRAAWWARPVAVALCAREAAALAALDGIEGVPRLLRHERGFVERSFIAGQPLYRAAPPSRSYFVSARTVLAALRRRHVAHNDLAKEANWLCTPDGRAALVDFQLAVVARGSSRGWRALAYDDLRHLLKHKRTYLPSSLTARERRVLARPSTAARLWRSTAKPAYLWITRRWLGWPERGGPAERER
jgi:RIO-like serine/threonine protein kinase